MKGIRTLLCVISLAFSSVVMSDVMAQKDLFNSLAVGVGVGTTGVDVNVATPITSHFALRGGLHNSEHPHPVFPPQLASFEL